MSKKKQTYLGFDFDKKFYKILSVVEKANGELIIFPIRGLHYNEINNLKAGELILNQHYSIHNSEGSKYGNNYINHTIDFANSSKRSSKIVTRALKHNNLYVPLFSGRAPNLGLLRLVKKAFYYLLSGDLR